MSEQIGYDALLESRVRQLKEIDERLERVIRTVNGIWDWESNKESLIRLRRDIADMIIAAEAESAAF